jgi:hypothetical protein
MRHDDFELESSREEKDWAHMHDSQNRDIDMSAGYAFPRGPSPFLRGSIPTQNHHDAFSELMATSIVPELMYF